MENLNKGFDVGAYLGFKGKAEKENWAADRDKTAVAEWVQGEEANVSIEGKTVNIGSDDGINMMEMILASLAACDVAVVGLHASLMGIKLNGIRAEMRGQYNVAAMLGIEGAGSAGYKGITAKIFLDAPDLSPEHIEKLIEACKRGSPVGHTFGENVPTHIEIIKT